MGIGEQIGEMVGGFISPQFQKGDLILDISHHNGVINFAKVAADPQKVKGIFIKSSEGATSNNSMFIKNVKGCVENNIKWGPYHFATWNDENEARDAKEEANFFLKVVKNSGHYPSLPFILDIESNDPIPYTKDEMVEFVKIFTDTVIAEGHKIGIYASPGFMDSYLPKNHPFTNLKLWVADYSGTINPVPGWTKPWLHQYSESGTISGILTKTDMNRIL